MSNSLRAPERRAEPALRPTAPQASLGAPSARPTATATTARPLTLIGSRGDCHLPIAHGDVSKLHAAVCNTGDALLLCDLRSRTGTFVDGANVARAALRPGISVRVGPIDLRCEIAAGPADDTDPTRLPLPLRLSGPSLQAELTVQPAVIGRRANCDVLLDTPDVSLAHALLFLLDGRPVICDLGSRSGTLVNGERVEMSYLCDGDQLLIGGEPLTVEWKGADARAADAPTVQESAQVPAAATTAAAFAASSANPAAPAPLCTLATAPAPKEPAFDALAASLLSPPAGAPLGLEGTLATLQAQVFGLRGTIEKRAGELAQREAELAAAIVAHQGQVQILAAAQQELGAGQAALVAERDALTAGRTQLVAERAEYESLRAKLSQRETALQLAEQDYTQRQAALTHSAEQLETERQLLARLRDELNAAQVDLDAQRAQLGAAQESLAAQRTALETERALVATDRGALTAEQAALRGAQVALEDREARLHEREQALMQRESTSNEAVLKIAAIKQSLEEAARAFAEMDGAPGAPFAVPTVDAPQAPALEAERVAAARPPARTTPRAATKAAPPAATHAADAAPGQWGDLPAPCVDQPLFGNLQNLPRDQWPAEVQQRVRVLSRLSRKSEEELLPRVLAEMAAQRSQPPTPDGKADRKGKSRWWV